MGKIDQVTEALISLNGALTAAQPIIGLASTAILLLWKKFRESNPNASEEDFIALLSGEAAEGIALSSTYLQDHGFTLVDGKWVPPAS